VYDGQTLQQFGNRVHKHSVRLDINVFVSKFCK